MCCKGDSITKTNTGKELRSIFQPSVLQTPRNENNLCNLNRINPSAPKGSGSLFLGYKHCHPGFRNDRLKVQIGVEVRPLHCGLAALSWAGRQGNKPVRGLLPSLPGRLLLHPISHGRRSQRGPQSRPACSASSPPLVPGRGAHGQWPHAALGWQVEPALWDARARPCGHSDHQPDRRGTCQHVGAAPGARHPSGNHRDPGDGGRPRPALAKAVPVDEGASGPHQLRSRQDLDRSPGSCIYKLDKEERHSVPYLIKHD